MYIITGKYYVEIVQSTTKMWHNYGDANKMSHSIIWRNTNILKSDSLNTKAWQYTVTTLMKLLLMNF